MAGQITDFDVVRTWVKVAEKFQQEEFMDSYNRNTALYDGKDYRVRGRRRDVDESKLTVNTVGPTVDSMVASYYARNPRPVVSPKRESFSLRGGNDINGQQAARLIEDLVWHTAKETNLRQQVKLAARDAEVCGYGKVELGWTASVERLVLPASVSATGQKQEYTAEYMDHIRKNSPYVKYRNARQWLIPPTAEWSELPFEILCEDVPLELVLSEPNFEKKALAELKEKVHGGNQQFLAGADSEDGGRPKPFYGAKIDMASIQSVPEFGTIRLYHYWNAAKRKYYVYTKELDSFLREGDWPFEKLEGYPSETLVFIEGYGAYPVAPVEWYADQARQKNTLRRRLLDAVEKSVVKILTMSKDKQEIERVRKGGHGAVCEVKDNNAYKAMELSGIPPTWLTFEQILDNDIVRGSGSTDARSQLASRAELATELVQQEAGFKSRITHKQDALRGFLERIFRKIWQLYAEFADEKQTLRISPDDGGLAFREWSKDDIQGEYDFEINVELAALDSPAREIAQTSQMLSLAQNFQDVVGPDGRRELMQRLLKAMKVESPETIAEPPVDPDARRAAELEFQVMVTGNPIEPQEGENHQEHAKMHMLQMQLLSSRQQLQGQASPEEMKAAVLLQQHVQQTLQMMSTQGSVQSPSAMRLRQPKMNTSVGGSMRSPGTITEARSQGQAAMAEPLRGAGQEA